MERGCPGIGWIIDAALGSRLDPPPGLERLDEAREAYLEEARRRRVYGYCTGLGALHSRSGCGPGYERRVLEEHAVGAGPHAHPYIVRAFMATRILQLTAGQAPVRSSAALRILEALNHRITPLVPLYGSVGASGDLAPSAHAFLCIYYGVGEALYGGERVTCAEALEASGLGVLELEPGEALALINNTAWSTGAAALGVEAARRALSLWLDAARASLEAAGCNPEHYDPGVLSTRRHRGVAEAAERLRGCPRPTGRLQDPYSLRCTPMIGGAALELIEYARGVVEREACAPTENPTVAHGRVWHWCGFHAIYPGLAADAAALSVSHLVGASERRIAQLLRGEVTGLPDFLAGEGSPVGAMITQYTAASMAAEARRESCPATVHSIPTSGLQEDYVSMAPMAAYKLVRLAGLLAMTAAIEESLARAAASWSGNVDPRVIVEEARRRVSGDPLLEWATSGRLAL